MQCQSKAGGEEEGDRNHMRRVIVEVAIGISDVIDPIEVAKDAIGKSVAPRRPKAQAE
jgi:hypothetical protein